MNFDFRINANKCLECNDITLKEILPEYEEYICDKLSTVTIDVLLETLDVGNQIYFDKSINKYLGKLSYMGNFIISDDTDGIKLKLIKWHIETIKSAEETKSLNYFLYNTEEG